MRDHEPESDPVRVAGSPLLPKLSQRAWRRQQADPKASLPGTCRFSTSRAFQIRPASHQTRELTDHQHGHGRTNRHHRFVSHADAANGAMWMTDKAYFLLPALLRARDLIDRDYAEPLDLEAMAAEAGYSRFHFARAFNTAYGETPRAYLTRRRIERAKTLLRTANLSVTEVCLVVGFSSLGSFSKRFRELVGQSPSEYRDDAVARTGVPPIPGCVVLMWTRPHPKNAQSRRSTIRPRPATVPHDPQPKEHQ
jgi:AraC-like DNA-binding protein